MKSCLGRGRISYSEWAPLAAFRSPAFRSPEQFPPYDPVKKSVCHFRGWLRFAALVIATSTSVQSARAIVINEINYNPPDNTVRTEFIELYNESGGAVDLSGWRFNDGIEYVFPAGTSLAPGGYLVVASEPAVMQQVYGVEALGPWTGALSSDGERVRLINASGEVIDEVDYRPGFPWPVSANGNGASMELMDPSLDNDLGSSWRPSFIPPDSPNPAIGNAEGSPGARNRTAATAVPPNIRQVTHVPEGPLPATPFPVTAKVTDPDGVGAVTLRYQVVHPGRFIPAELPLPVSNGIINVNQPRQPNPEFEDSANWSEIVMTDDGTGGDLVAGDSIYTATVPGQPNRTLVRYRIEVADLQGNSQQWPYPDDRRRNFAAFVYQGVPDYEGIPAAQLTQLPVYHFLTRLEDYNRCTAYDSTSSRLSGGTPGYTYENWEGAFVVGTEVYDHIRYRLHGGNGRYDASGQQGAATYAKRSFIFQFNRGHELQAYDQSGKPYPTRWRRMVTQNLWENRATITFSLNEAVNYHLFSLVGVPAPFFHWAHLRLISREDEQADPYRGDFWGLLFCQENYDGRFLDAHDLPKGNLYKLNRDDLSGLAQQRYQAPFAVKGGVDHNWVRTNLRGTTPPETVQAHVELDEWARYHAICQAVRHYDYWPSGDNNSAHYFYPDYRPENRMYGRLWVLPWDVDATWGPTWNNGHDLVFNTLFPSSSEGGDSASNPTLWPVYYNAVRAVRDLIWQPDQINPLIDYYANFIRPLADADMKRWAGAPRETGNYGSLRVAGVTVNASTKGTEALDRYIADMKKFAWTGGAWPGGSMISGGSARALDNLERGRGEGGKTPQTPEISYTGEPGYPVDGLRFRSSPFADPNADAVFGGMQWRIAETTDPQAPAFDPLEPPKMEWTATWESEVITTFAEEIEVPVFATRGGRTYRARVRHQDETGRWSHWSAPVTFTATAPDLSAFRRDLVIRQFLYDPPSPSPAELAAGYEAADFEWIELMNAGSTPLPLAGLRFTKGIDFDFDSGVLAPGATVLVVASRAAFELRYGTGYPIAGEWGEAGGRLNNDGENLKLSYGAGDPIREFTYSPDAPWPDVSGGLPLVLADPLSNPDHAVAASWSAGPVPGGQPSMGPSFPGDPAADADGDGRVALLEAALGSSDTISDRDPPLAAELDADGPLFRYLRSTSPPVGVRLTVQVSADATTWQDDPGDGSLLTTVAAEPAGAGVERIAFRPAPSATWRFARLQAVLAP